MMLMLHIIIAITSVLYSTYLFLSPSKEKFTISYGLVGLTLATGSFLVFLQPSHMTQACVSGLAYTSFVLIAIVAAKKRFAKAFIRS